MFCLSSLTAFSRKKSLIPQLKFKVYSAWAAKKRSNNVVIYGRHEARGAHISKTTRGGEAILKHLRKID